MRLVQEFGVARDTIRKAIRQLREKDLLYKVPSLGNFVGSSSNAKSGES
ncbi:hypothetical protein [Nonomuraea bangladeshensis]